MTEKRLQQMYKMAFEDCYDEAEQMVALQEMITDEVECPFRAKVDGENVTVVGIYRQDFTPEIEALCLEGDDGKYVGLEKLQPLGRPPVGYQWVQAYLRWRDDVLKDDENSDDDEDDSPMMWHDNFPKSMPREAKGGIKAQSKSGGFGKSWWAKRWIQVLEGFSIGSRLSRGRSYARGGQVLDIAIEAGVVTAKVQGSRAKPYAVRIAVNTLSAEQSAKLGAALGEQAIFAAKLLAGDMPQDIEQVFAAAQLSLFPSKLDDLTTECSCPDWSNPCKHVAAVYYLIGEEFDRDPFLLFKLRGIDRERLLASLEVEKADEPAAKPARKKAKIAASPTEPLSPDTNLFWHGCDLPGDLFGEISPPPIPAALPRRLGNFPFWRGQKPLLESVEPIYVAASERGLGLE